MFAHAIAEITPGRAGIHVVWAGPAAWLYSPTGWRIQRRVFERTGFELDCVRLAAVDVEQLRARRERTIRHGALTLRAGQWPRPVAGTSAAPPQGCEVVTLALSTPRRFVRVDVEASASFVVGLRDGRVVAGGSILTALAAHPLTAPEMDTVVLYALGLKTFGMCLPRGDGAGWDAVPVAKTLQLPIRELMPALVDAEAEFAEAKSRLIAGETLDRGEFELLTETLRAIVNGGGARPIDLALLVREDLDDPQELGALDPIRTLLIHPRWRRVLGFAWFDDDPALLAGQTYEYRVQAGFPARDLSDRVVGFHTVPSRTALPAEIYLGDIRLRFPQPRTVELADPDNGRRRQITRRGVTLAAHDQPWWQVPSLDVWSVVVDFPTAVATVFVDVRPGHELSFAFGAAWQTPSTPAALPPGPRARLDFPSPTHQLLLGGRGFLEAIRIPPGPVALDPQIDVRVAVAEPVRFVDSPLPGPPFFATLANLQLPRAVETDVHPSVPTPPPHDLGFEIRWRPAPRAGVTVWPVDLAAAPPLDAALFQIEHRQTAPTASDWRPVSEDENYTVGDRAHGAPTPPIHPGVNLLTVFPEVRPPIAGALDLFWRDVFDFDDDGNSTPDLPRPAPPPGTFHQYRVRAVDAIGRPSATWVETNALRLEKHVPPPLPAAPDLKPADQLAEPAITGVRARVLVRDAPDLTTEEQAILGTHQSAITLTWGWHDEQRRQDHYAREFRIYHTARTPGRVRARILTVVAQAGGRFDTTIDSDRPFIANAGQGSIIEADAQFRVLAHGAGPATFLLLRALERDAAGAYIPPVPGLFDLPIRLTPDQTRAQHWGNRVAVQAIDDRTVYSETLFDLFDLSPEHPRDVVQVGVSAADAQDYVPDPLAPASTRPGNESPIVAVPCEGRWYGRPVVVDVPSLAPVAVIVTPAPGTRRLRFRLDLTPHTPLAPAALVRPERVPDDEVFAAYRIDGTRLIARVPNPAPGDVEQDVTVPNTADRAAIVAALAGGEVSALEDRFVVFLASVHPHRARLFQAAVRDPIALERFDETLPNRGARWVYRLRAADAAGRLSADALTVRAIVRVPLTSALAAPVRSERVDPRVVLRVAGGSEVTELLIFMRTLTTRAASRDDAQVLRVASVTGATSDRVRLRVGDGTLIVPSVKSLADGDVVRDGPYRLVTVEAPAGELVRIWACAATRDGIVSPPGGPWRVQGGAQP